MADSASAAPNSWRESFIVYGALFFANFIFAGAAVIYKLSLLGMSPIILSFYRQMGAWPVLMVIAYFTERTWPKREDIKWFFFVGFIGVYMNQLLFTIGISYAGAILSTVLQLAAPPIAAVLAILFKAEKFSAMKMGGIALAVVGAIVLVGPTDISLDSDRSIGIGIFLVQNVFIGLFLIFQKRLLTKYPPVTVTTGIYMTAAPFITITALVFVRDPAQWVPNQTGIGAILYAIFAHSVVGYLILGYANRHSQSSIVAAMNCSQAPLAAIMASIFADETFTGTDFLGTLIIVAGLAIITYQRYLEQKEEALDQTITKEEAIIAPPLPQATPGSPNALEAANDQLPQSPEPTIQRKIKVVVVGEGEDEEMIELDTTDSPSPVMTHAQTAERT